MPTTPPTIGQPAPDVTLRDEHDEALALRDLWLRAERGIVLSFLRHYG